MKKLSEEETQTLNQDIEEQTKTYIADLVEKAVREGKEKSKFTLELSEWVTLGSAVSGWGTIVVLYGEVEKILLDSRYKYLMSVTKTYEIIPKTELVVIVYISASDFGGQLEYHTILYAFFKSAGWKSISVN